MNMVLRLTKKDCIVVFCCAGFSLMSLGAIGGGSRERARRILCKANLYQWYAAMKGFADDNDGKLLGSYGFKDTAGQYTAIYPNECWLDSQQSPLINDWEHSEQVSHEALASYLPGFNDKGLRVEDIIGLPTGVSDTENFRFKGAWRCPSNTTDNLADLFGRLGARGYFRLRYSVYSRVDLWSDFATDPDDFVANELKAGKLLMADPIFYWSPSDYWLYNHGKFGASDDSWGNSLHPIDAMTGINKLFGDGSVRWKDKSEFDPLLFTNPYATEPRLNAGYGAYFYY